MSTQIQNKAIRFYEKGNVLYQAGKLSESEACYRKAIKIKRDFAEAYGNLGNVLKDMGRIKEATGAYRKALNIYPNHPLLLNNLGNMYQLSGETQKAIEYFRKSLERDPKNPDAWNNLGNMLKEMTQPDESEDCYRQALALNPHFAEAHNNLGKLLSRNGRNAEAIVSFQQAIQDDPKNCDSYINLGVALMEINRTDDAANLLRTAVELQPDNECAHINLGIALKNQGYLRESLNVLHKVMEIAPGNKEAHLNLSTTLRAQGNIDEALSEIKKALNIDPEYADALRSLAFTKKFEADDATMPIMENLFSNANTSMKQKMHLGFALGKAYEDIHEYDKAAFFVNEANSLKRTTIDYSTEETDILFQQLRDAYSSTFFTEHSEAGYDNNTPIFIIGMPRSGTSLVEQILSSHAQVHGAGELKAFSELTRKFGSDLSFDILPRCIQGFDNGVLTSLGKSYIQVLRKFSGNAKYITDKMPHNFMYIGLIMTALPNAKIICCIRDPMDNCLSIYKNLFGFGHHYAYDQTELGKYYRQYIHFMEHIRNVMPGKIYDIQYEQLVSDQVNETRKLLEYCGLPWDDSCLSFHKTQRAVSTLSAVQVRRSIYKDSVALWQKYGSHLEPLQQAIYE